MKCSTFINVICHISMITLDIQSCCLNPAIFLLSGKIWLGYWLPLVRRPLDIVNGLALVSGYPGIIDNCQLFYFVTPWFAVNA